MKAIVFALLVLAIAHATQDDVIAQIKRIDSTPFGKTILDTIALQIEANDPLDRLLSTLHDLEDRYIAEQKVDDEAHGTFQDSCNVDIKRYDNEIAQSDTERIQLEARLEGQLYPQREILQSVEKTKQREVREYQKSIDEVDAQRAEEAEVFEAKVTEHEEATAVIAEARRLFADNIEGASFIQKGKISSDAKISASGAALIQKHFQTHAKRVSKFVHRKAYAKLFKVLATIASKAAQLADQGAVGRIVQLCDELLHKISESLDLERFAEDKRIQAYKAARNLLVISLNVANSDLANIQTQLASVNSNIAQTEATLDNTNQRLENLNEARTDRYNQCEEEAGDYQDGRAARDADRQVVSDTIGLVNQQLRTLKEQLALRLSAGDSFE